jgi:hypothetical protein
MSTQSITEASDIILKFRETVAARYDYELLSQRMTLPAGISRAVLGDVQRYFLECLYPVPEERAGLEAAFEHLGRYVRQPQKIFGIFGNLAGAVFKFGRYFFKALQAAFGALDAFLGAKKFEQSMTIIANRNGIVPPLSDEDFEYCISLLDRRDFEKFIADVTALFGLMMDTVLRQKTIGILNDVIATMHSKPHVYPQHDIDGITLGRELLLKGDHIFSKYDDQTRKDILLLVRKNEYWYLDKIYTGSR